MKKIHEDNLQALQRLELISELDEELLNNRDAILNENISIQQRIEFLQFSKNITSPVNKYLSYIEQGKDYDEWLDKYDRKSLFLFMDEIIESISISNCKVSKIKFRNGFLLNQEDLNHENEC